MRCSKCAHAGQGAVAAAAAVLLLDQPSRVPRRDEKRKPAGSEKTRPEGKKNEPKMSTHIVPNAGVVPGAF